jgi:hypothetical protein
MEVAYFSKVLTDDAMKGFVVSAKKPHPSMNDSMDRWMKDDEQGEQPSGEDRFNDPLGLGDEDE